MQRIHVPADAEAQIGRAVRNVTKGGAVAACLWCGHGFPNYKHKIEDEHFANSCPNAPEELKASAKKRLG